MVHNMTQGLCCTAMRHSESDANIIEMESILASLDPKAQRNAWQAGPAKSKFLFIRQR